MNHRQMKLPETPVRPRPDYSWLPRPVQPTALIIRGVEINAELEQARQNRTLDQLQRERARRQAAAKAEIQAQLTAYSEEGYQPLAAAMLEAANCDTEPFQWRAQEDPTVAGLQLAAVELALDHFTNEWTELYIPLWVMNPHHPHAPAPGSDQQERIFLQAVVKKYFEPLAAGEKYRDLFRELPAPVILAGMAYVNCRLLENSPEPGPAGQSPAADRRLIRKLWRCAGAMLEDNPTPAALPAKPAA